MRQDAEFSQKTRRELAIQAGLRCSICDVFTGFGAGGIGEAAHIRAASEKEGPRSEPTWTNAQLRDPSNGIWLCANCHRKVDANTSRKFADWTVEELQERRRTAIDRADNRIGKLQTVNTKHLEAIQRELNDLFQLFTMPRLKGLEPAKPYDRNDPFRFQRLRSFIPFVGRVDETRCFMSFLEAQESDPFSWMVVTGPAGVGKSRFADEMTRLALGAGWHAGRMGSGQSGFDWGKLNPAKPTLIVIDYCASELETIRPMILALAENRPPEPVRVLLIERSGDPEFGWLHEVFSSYSGEVVSLIEGAFRGVLELPTLEKSDTQDLGLAVWTRIHPAKPYPQGANDAFSKSEQRPLFLALTVEAIAKYGIDSVRKWDRSALLRSVVERQINAWKALRIPDAALNVIVVATFLQSPVQNEVLDTLQDIQFQALGGFSEGIVRKVAPFEPDLLGEFFVRERWLVGRGTDGNSHAVKLRMREALAYALSLNVSAVISFLGRTAQDFGASEFLPEALEIVFAQQLSEEELGWVVSSLRTLHTFLEVLNAIPGLSNPLVDVLLQKAFELPGTLYERMQTFDLHEAVSPQLTVQFYTGWLRDENASVRKHVLARMIAAGVRPDEITFNTLLNKRETFAQADDVFARMLGAKVVPDQITFSTLLNKAETFAQADDVFARMLGAEVVPNQITFSTLLNKAETFAQADVVFSRMFAAKVAPNQITFSTLLNRAETFAQADVVFSRMLVAQVAPNQITFNSLLNKAETFAQADDVFARMLGAEVVPNQITFNSLLNKAETFGQADDVFARMLPAGISPDRITFATFMKKVNTWEEAVDVLQRMESLGISGNDRVYLRLITLVPERIVIDLLETLRDAGVELNAYHQNKLRSRFGKTELWARIQEFF